MATQWVKQLVFNQGLAQAITTDVLDVQAFNVTAAKYGAKGDGVTDDTAAIQAAINDALAVSGEVFFPPLAAGKTYLITSTLNINGSGTTPRSVRLYSPPNETSHGQILTYNGSSNSSVMALSGVEDCQFVNIGIGLASGLSNVTVWDYQFPAAFGNTGSYNRHTKCNTIFTNNLNCVWLRIGQGPGGSSAFDMVFEHCLVGDNTTNSGSIAAQIGGSQAYSPAFYDCSFNTSCNILCGPVASSVSSALANGDTVIHVADCLLFPASGTISIGGNQAAYTSKSVQSGAGVLNLQSAWAGGSFNGNQISLVVGSQVYVGNCSFKFTGGTLSGNSMGYDILILTSGYAEITNSQCQCNAGTPRRFLQTGVGGSSVAVHLTLRSLNLKGFAPPTLDANGVMWLHFNTTLTLKNFSANRNDGTAYSSSGYLISNSGSSAFGNIRLEDCDIYATFPFINNAANQQVHYSGVQLVNSSNSVQSVIDDNPLAYKSITANYTATTADHTITANATSGAITVTLPALASVPSGYEYRIKKMDSSANAVTVTPNGTEKIDGAATFSLATQYKFLTIRADSTNSNWDVFGSN